MVDLGMAFVDNWVVGKEKVCYWLSRTKVLKYGSMVQVFLQDIYLRDAFG